MTSIRLARPDEVGRLQAVELDAARRYAEWPGYAFCAAFPARSEEEHARVRQDGVALVVDRDGEVAGFALGIPLDGRAHLLEAAVAFRRQGEGVGGALFSAFEAWGRDAGLDEATLTTYRDVPWNAALYRRRGYEAFTPGPGRPSLLDLLADEIAAGFHRMPRLAMRKALSSSGGAGRGGYGGRA